MNIVFAGRAPTVDPVRFYPLDPTNPAVAKHRPLALAILADYGDPTGPAARVSAIMDWVARTAIHGHSGLRLPTPYLRGTATLPVGASWATVQAKLTQAQQETDNAYWATFNHDAEAILNVLLGTLQADGTRANDGAMEPVTGNGAQAHFRYKSLSTVRSVWCSWQHDICTLLLATIGYPSMLAHIDGHDPLHVQYGDRGEWGYWCSTYNEHYVVLDGNRPLSLAELRGMTQAGLLDLVARQPHAGPSWDPLPYVSASYLADHPTGWPTWAASLDSRIVPGGIGSRLDRAIEEGYPTGIPRVRDDILTPYLGAYAVGLPSKALVSSGVRVASGWPGTVGFQTRRAGEAWTNAPAGAVSGTAIVRVFDGESAVEVAPVDASGQRGPGVTVLPTQQLSVEGKSVESYIVAFAKEAADSDDPQETTRLLDIIGRLVTAEAAA